MHVRMRAPEPCVGPRPRAGTAQVLRALLALCFAAFLTIALPFARGSSTLQSLRGFGGPRARAGPHMQPDRCHAIGANPVHLDTMHVNSRFLCVLSPVCFHAKNLTRALITVRRPNSPGFAPCVVTRAEPSRARGESPHRPMGDDSCKTLRYYALACAHGEGRADGVAHPLNNCTSQKVVDSSEIDRLDAENAILWYEGLTVLVPSYSWVFNIYHHGRQLNLIAHVIHNLRRYLTDETMEGLDRASRLSKRPLSTTGSVRVMFRMLGYFPDPWHMDMTRLFFRRILQRAPPNINVYPDPTYLFPAEKYRLICLRSAVVLGSEGATDALQFLNDTKIVSSPPEIPHAAISFKQAMYDATGLPSDFVKTTPINQTGFSSANSFSHRAAELSPEFSAFVAPPLTVGYATRPADAARRLERDDDAWLESVLQREARAKGFEFYRIDVPLNESLAKQVRRMLNISFLVGLHGANFANSMFMRPGTAMFEIFPYMYVKLFYRNGGNSGLRYSSYEVEAGVDKKCSPYETVFCQLLYRDVVVSFTERDKNVITEHIRKGMEYILSLREMHPSGIVPIQRDLHGGPYRIHNFTFPSSGVAVDQFPSTFGRRNIDPKTPYRPKVVFS